MTITLRNVPFTVPYLIRHSRLDVLVLYHHQNVGRHFLNINSRFSKVDSRETIMTCQFYIFIITIASVSVYICSYTPTAPNSLFYIVALFFLLYLWEGVICHNRIPLWISIIMYCLIYQWVLIIFILQRLKYKTCSLVSLFEPWALTSHANQGLEV